MAERHTLSPHALTGQTAIAAITNGNSGSIATLLIHPGKRFRTNDIESSEESRDTGRFQRVLEILFAAAALILSAPLMLLIAVLIRLDSKGPAVFQQWRVGKDGRLFRFRKFRTLYADARERFPHLYAYKYTEDEIRSLQFKVQRDPRVTRVGQWLRDSTLDELPNFWNVLTGDMALVGPRPEIPEMLAYYDERGQRKFCVRPGVTGLAQISGRGRLRFYETLEYDVEYVEKKSFLLDVKILFFTVAKVLVRDGAF